MVVAQLYTIQLERHSLHLIIHLPHLTHVPVRSGAFVVLEDDVRIVVDNQILEFCIVAGDFALGQPAGPQSIFRHVGYVLFEDERGHFLGSTS